MNSAGNDGPCIVCGCSCEFDNEQDRVCWCDACQWNGGCRYNSVVSSSANDSPCIVCGCSCEFNNEHDRVCWCDACQWNGGCRFQSNAPSDDRSSSDMAGTEDSESVFGSDDSGSFAGEGQVVG